MKKGVQTSEFWVTSIASFVGAAIPVLNSTFGWQLPTESIVAMVVAVAGPAMAYASSRGNAKKGADNA